MIITKMVTQTHQRSFIVSLAIWISASQIRQHKKSTQIKEIFRIISKAMLLIFHTLAKLRETYQLCRDNKGCSMGAMVLRTFFKKKALISL